MASSFELMFGMCRLRIRGSLLKSFQNINSCFQRNAGTNADAQVQLPGTNESEDKNGHKSLRVVQLERQEQAERSVLISCQPRTSDKKFLKDLSRHGEIKKYFFYESYGTYAVVEFASQEGVASLLDEVNIPNINHECMVPFKSRLLSLSNLNPTGPKNQSGQQCQPQTAIPINELIQRLSREETIDQQIISLKEAHQLTDENTSLRFLVCSLLKDITAAYFPKCTIRPFGSSLNGFGKLGCDLDMFLDLDDITGRTVKKPKSGLSLEYQMKQTNSERAVTQSILSVIGECLDQFVPGCVGIHKILNARCPLVRFSHQPSGFQCDLTANNRVATKSTELLYLYGELDPRVRYLVFSVRSWARAHSITSSIPGAWITNFSLTVMVLFFLQKRNPPILPTLDQLHDLAGLEDKCIIEGNDCTFVSDYSKIQLQNNTETLEQLLGEFFEFYATFAFSKMSVNIRKGKEQNKPEVAPLHIQNPFETSLNISKNVNVTQLERFVALCQESSWLLQQREIMTPSGGTGDNAPTPWGLATLLLHSRVKGIKSSRKRKREPSSDRMKSLLESLKSKNQQKKSTS